MSSCSSWKKQAVRAVLLFVLVAALSLVFTVVAAPAYAEEIESESTQTTPVENLPQEPEQSELEEVLTPEEESKPEEEPKPELTQAPALSTEGEENLVPSEEETNGAADLATIETDNAGTVSVKTDSVTVSTTDLKSLQDLINAATTKGDGIVNLGTADYKDGRVVLEGTVLGSYTFKGNGDATANQLNCGFIVNGATTTFLFDNVTLGSAVAFQATNGANLTLGSADKPVNGDVKVLVADYSTADQASNGNASSVSVVVKGDKDKGTVTADVKNGTVTVSNTIGDSVTYENKTNDPAPAVSVSAGTTVSANPKKVITLTRGDFLLVSAMTAEKADIVLKAPIIQIGTKDDGKTNTVKSLKATAASENVILIDDVVYSPVQGAEVNIYSSINATEDITVYSYVTQEGFSFKLDKIKDIQANVRIGSAEVNIADGVVLTAGKNLTVSAAIRASAGKDNYDVSIPSEKIPIAFNVYVEKAAVNIGKATLKATAGALTVGANSTIDASAINRAKKLSLAIATNVFINDACVNLKGAKLTAGQSVTVLSKAVSDAEADAQRGTDDSDLNGGFLACNVVIQNSKVNVGKHTDGTASSITSDGDITIRSDSNVEATDDAVASVALRAASGQATAAPTVEQILKKLGQELLKDILDQIFNSQEVKDFFKKLQNGTAFQQASSANISKAMECISKDVYTVTVDSSAQEKGTVKTGTEKGTDEKTYLTVSVVSDYEVSKVLVRYLDPTFIYKDKKAVYAVDALKLAPDGKYKIELPSLEELADSNFRVYVVYGAQKNGESSGEIPAPENSDNESFNIEEYFNSAAESSVDDTDADKDCAGTIALNYTINVNGSASDEASILTDAVNGPVDDAEGIAYGLTAVAAGKAVRFNINCRPGLELDKLEAKYTDVNGAPKTVTIEMNGAGHYVLTIPEDIRINDGKQALEIIAEFSGTASETNAGGGKSNSASTIQKTGSLGVGVILNTNRTLVDIGNEKITAVGKISIDGNAVTSVVAVADGTSVTEEDITKGKNVVYAAGSTNAGRSDFAVKDKSGKDVPNQKVYVLGTNKEGDNNSAVLDGTVYTVTLKPYADRGYFLPGAITLYITGEDNVAHKITVAKDDSNNYVADLSKIDFLNDTLTDKTQQGGYGIRSVRFVAVYDAVTYPISLQITPEEGTENTHGSCVFPRQTVTPGESFTVSVKPDNDYRLGTATLKYKNSVGSEVTRTLVVDRNKSEFKLEVPMLSELNRDGSGLSVEISFVQAVTAEYVGITVWDDPCPISTLISVDRAAALTGEKVTISLTNPNTKLDRSKLKITYKEKESDKEAKTIDLDEKFTFTVPTALNQAYGIRISAAKAEENPISALEVPLNIDTTVTNGKITTTAGKVFTGKGDTLRIYVEPNAEYVLSGNITVFQGNKTLGTPTRISNGVYQLVIPDSIDESAAVQVTARFKKGDNASSSVGIAVAVNVAITRNYVLVQSGTISAGKAIAVNGTTAGKVSTSAKAGYNGGKTGISGAVAVEVSSFRTQAEVFKGVKIFDTSTAQDQESLSVQAKTSLDELTTEANAANTRPKAGTVTGTGIGTGVAVAVNSIDTYASIDDGVENAYTRKIGKVTVSAANEIWGDLVSAVAGTASGKLAATPVVAVDVFGSNARAYLGSFANNKHLYAGAAEVSAVNTASHTVSAAGSASVKGSAVYALSGSFAVSVIKDSARAILNCPISGAQTALNVFAKSDSTLLSNATASSAGAKTGSSSEDGSKGTADNKVDRIIGNTQTMAAKSGSGSASTTEATVTNRQQAQTSEGCVGGAAAVVVNVQSNTSLAEVKNGAHLGTRAAPIGDVSVSATGNTCAELCSNASTVLPVESKTGTGIGVAVAVNIVSSNITATIGNGSLHAANVAVTAANSTDDQGKETVNEFKTVSISGVGNGKVGVAGCVAVAVLNNTTKATITKLQNDFYKTASTTVSAKDIRTAEATATAAVNQDGSPDKNASKSDSKKSEDADKGKKVGFGASFAMIYGENEVSAIVSVPETADCGLLSVLAESDHTEISDAVAGMDPYKDIYSGAYSYLGTSTNIAIDAAVAVHALNTTVQAKLMPAASSYVPTVSATGVHIRAVEKGSSKTNASGFAIGNKTAVGGAVAVNLNSSNVTASNTCVLKVSGGDTSGDDGDVHRSVEITASSQLIEENNAFALASGNDVTRYVERFKELLGKIEGYRQKIEAMIAKTITAMEALSEIINGILDGSYIKQVVEKNTSNLMNKLATKLAWQIQKVLDKLPKDIAMDADDDLSKTNILPLSSKLLQLMEISTEDTAEMDEVTDEATAESVKEINGTDTSDLTGTESNGTNLDNNAKAGKNKEGIRIAAAVGVCISKHEVTAENTKAVETNGGVTIAADTTVDAIAHSIGFANCPNGGIGAIGLAVAVKIDNNTTKAYTNENLIIGNGCSAVITSALNENTKADYKNTLGVEAIAGGVSKEATVAISGAVAVFLSKSVTTATTADGVSICTKSNQHMANLVEISARETARQTMRTASLSYGADVKLSMGCSVGVFKTTNTLSAKVGKNSVIRAKNISVLAIRARVSSGNADSTSPEATVTEGKANYGTDSSKTSGEDCDNLTGVTVKALGQEILTIDTSYASKTETSEADKTAKVNADQKTLIGSLQKALNSLSVVDYYIAIDTGSISTQGAITSSKGIGSIAGSVAVVLISNTVEASVGEGSTLTATNDITVDAKSEEDTRVIAGAITNNAGKTGFGATVAFVKEGHTIKAIVDDSTMLSCGGKLSVHAENTGSTEVYTVTGVKSSSLEAKAVISATVNVLLSTATVDAKLGTCPTGKSHSAGSVSVHAINSKSFTDIAVSLEAGTAQSAMAGGAVSVIRDKSSAKVTAKGIKIDVKGIQVSESKVGNAVEFLAVNTHPMTVAVCSASLAKGASANIAAVVAVILDTSAAETDFSSSAVTVNSAANPELGGNVVIRSANNSSLLNANIEVATGGNKISVGGTVTVSILRRTCTVNADAAYVQIWNGSAVIHSDCTDYVTVIAAGASSTGSLGISIEGTIVVCTDKNTVTVSAKNAVVNANRAGLTLKSCDADIGATFTGGVYGIAGGLSLTSGSAGVGATVVVLVNKNTVKTDLSNIRMDISGKTDLCATANSDLLLVCLGATKGGIAIQGSVVTVVTTDEIEIVLDNTQIECTALNIQAKGTGKQNLIAGSLSLLAGKASIGPAVVVYIKERKVQVTAGPNGKIGGVNGCPMNIDVLADDTITYFIVAMGSAGKAAIDAAVSVIKLNNTVLCKLEAPLYAGASDVNIRVHSKDTIGSYMFGGGFSASFAAVPVVTVIYFNSNTSADIRGDVTGRAVLIESKADFTLKEVAAGAAVGLAKAAVSGTVAVVLDNSSTTAYFTGAFTGKGNGSALSVRAYDETNINSTLMVLDAGSAAVGVTAAVTVLKNTVGAGVGDKSGKTQAKNISAESVTVDAESIRSIVNKLGTCAAGLKAGISVNVAVIVAGSKLPQDAFNMLTQPEGDKTTFDTDTLVSGVLNGNEYAAKLLNSDGKWAESLKAELEANGQKDSSVTGSDVQAETSLSVLTKTDTTDYKVAEGEAEEADTLRGENEDIDPSLTDAGVKENSKVADSVPYTYISAPSCAVTAYLHNVIVTADTVNVRAVDQLNANADMLNIGGGLTAGASVGVAVVVLHSNVTAQIGAGTQVTCRELSIIADSGSGEKGSISVLGGAYGAGLKAGVSVAVAVVHLDNVTMARLDGVVKAAARGRSSLPYSVLICAKSNYPIVSAMTKAGSIGLSFGLGASTAVISMNGKTTAGVSGKILSLTDSKGNVIGGFSNVDILVFFNNTLTASAASFSGSLKAVTVGVTVVLDALTTDAYIDTNAVVELDDFVTGAVPVLRVMTLGSYDPATKTVTQGSITANAVVGLHSGGLTNAGVSVVIAKVKPTVKNRIAGTVKNTRGGLAVYVGSDLHTSAVSKVDTDLVGIGELGVSVILAFNYTDVRSTVTGSVTAEGLSVLSLLSADASATMEKMSLSIGSNRGVTVAVAILEATNEAAVNTGAKIEVGTLNVMAGASALSDYQKGADFNCTAQVYSGALSLTGGTRANVAVAVNKANNYATVKSTGGIKADRINVAAFGNPTAISKVQSLNTGLTNTTGAACASNLKFVQKVTVDCSNLTGKTGSKLTDVTACSYLYSPTETGSKDRNYAQAEASYEAGNYSISSMDANVAYSKNSTTSMVSAKFGTKIGSAQLINNASANSRATITLVGGQVLSKGANVVLSFAKADFTNKLIANGVAGNVDVLTDYVSDARAAAKSESLSLGNLKVNVIVAKTTTDAPTTFDNSGKELGGQALNVSVNGNSVTKAELLKANAHAETVNAGICVIESILHTTQKAEAKNFILTAAKPQIKVSSFMNVDQRSIEYVSEAAYEGLGTAYFTGVAGNIIVIIAKNYAVSEALASDISAKATSGAPVQISRLEVTSTSRANAYAHAGTSDRLQESNGQAFTGSLLGLGVIVAHASNDSTNKASLINMSVNALEIAVLANMHEASAIAVGGTSSGGVSVDLLQIKVNTATATNKATNSAVMKGCSANGSSLSAGSVVVSTAANTVYAYAEIGSTPVGVKVSVLSVTANVSKAVNTYTGTASVTDSQLSGTTMTVSSLENNEYYLKDAKYITEAYVGTAGVRADSGSGISVKLVNGDGNKATARNTATVKATVTNTGLNGYALTVSADGRSDAAAGSKGNSNIGLLQVGVVLTDSVSSGTVEACYNPTSAKNSLSSLAVKAVGAATAESNTGVQGGVDASIVNTKVNLATAESTMKVSSILSGGTLKVSGNAAISSIGTSVVKSGTTTPKFSLGAIKVAVNKAVSTNNIEVATQILPGDYDIGGKLTAVAKVPDATEEKARPEGHPVIYYDLTDTEAVVMPSAGESKDGKKQTSISFLEGSGHVAEAYSIFKVTLQIGKDAKTNGSGTINAKKAEFTAEASSKLNAEAKDVDKSYSIATFGALTAKACTSKEIAKDQIERNKVEIGINLKSLTVGDRLSVSCNSKACDVQARASSPGGFTLIDGHGNVSSVSSTIDNTISRITIAPSTTITAGTSADILAANHGSAETKITASGSKYSIAEIKTATVPGSQTYTTEILFGEGSSLTAGTDVSLKTETYAGGESQINQASAGVILDCTKTYGTMNGTSNSKIELEKGAAITSKNASVSVNMNNSGNMKATSDYSNPAFALAGGNQVKSTINYTGNNTLKLKEGAAIGSAGKTVIRQDYSGLKATSTAACTTRAGINFSSGNASTTLNCNNLVELYNNSQLASNGETSVWQYGAADRVVSNGNITVTIAFGKATGAGESTLNINNTLDAKNGGQIKAGKILLVQGASKLNIRSGCVAVTSGAVYKVNGAATNKVTINNKLSGSGAVIGDGAYERSFVSDIRALNSAIEAKMEAMTSGISFGSKVAKNELSVESKFKDSPYSGFTFYQNKCARNQITGADKKNTIITYIPDNLPEYIFDKIPSGETIHANEHPDITLDEVLEALFSGELHKMLDEYESKGRPFMTDAKSYGLCSDGEVRLYGGSLFVSHFKSIDALWLLSLLELYNPQCELYLKSNKDAAMETFDTILLNSAELEMISRVDDVLCIVLRYRSDAEDILFEISIDLTDFSAQVRRIDGDQVTSVSLLLFPMGDQWYLYFVDNGCDEGGELIYIDNFEENGNFSAYITTPVSTSKAID